MLSVDKVLDKNPDRSIHIIGVAKNYEKNIPVIFFISQVMKSVSQETVSIT
jgi:hypothetical protein